MGRDMGPDALRKHDVGAITHGGTCDEKKNDTKAISHVTLGRVTLSCVTLGRSISGHFMLSCMTPGRFTLGRVALRR